MEWIERLNEAIGYIEEHLTDEVDYEQLGQIACCSSYHSPTAFNRAFQSVHGIAPSAVKNEGVSVKSFPPILFKIMDTKAQWLVKTVIVKNLSRFSRNYIFKCKR